MEKLQLAVMFGGRACEHDVSIITALQCMAAVDPQQYDVIPVYIARDGAWYTGEKLKDLKFMREFNPHAAGVTQVYPDVTANSRALFALPESKGLFGKKEGLKVIARLDVALLAFHGMHGEDGGVQGLLELMNVPYTSAGLIGSSVGMDKIAMRRMFQGCGFPVLEMEWFTRQDWEADAENILARLEEKIPYPMFVKPANLGSSIGISKAKDQASLKEAIAVALSYDRRVLVERGVENPREVNCSVLGFDRDITPSVCEMPISWDTFLTFDEKYLKGAKGSKNGEGQGAKSAGGMEHLSRQIPAPIGEKLTKEIQNLAVEIFRALDCRGVVRIDFMLENDTVYVNEINTIPGSLSFYLWEPMGVKYSQLIDKLVEFALRAGAEKEKSVFAFDSNLLKQCSLGIKGAKN